MDPAVRRLIDKPFPHLKTYQEIATLLTPDDAELDRWFAELVEARDAIAFMVLGIAALGAGRPVDGRHLARGAALIADGQLIGCFAWHMTGDVPEHLLAATSDSQMIPSLSSMALFSIALICKERRGGVYPPELITRARLLSRGLKEMNTLGGGAVYGIAAITRDPALAAILKIDSEYKWGKAGNIARTLTETCCTAPFDLVASEPQRQIGHGLTVRRAAPRIGRNEPCPCESGRKYKNCCMARDAERLMDSSHVAGFSQTELRADPEPHLTLQRLRRCQAHELVGYDPRKIPAELLEDFFIGLCAFSLFDRAVECIELLGFADDLDVICDNFLFLASRAGRGDAVRKLLAVHPRAAELIEQMPLGPKLAMVEEDPVAFAAALEEGSLAALRSDDPVLLQTYAYSLLYSKLPAAGIFAARGAIASLSDDLALPLLAEIVLCRDKLGLSPDDPAGDILEQRLLEKTRGRATEGTDASRALAETRERLAAKAREVENLRKDLESVRRDVEKREAQIPAAPAPAAADERALQELRFKIQKLKGELNERHEERVTLRQELREAHSKLEEQTRQTAPDPATRDDSDSEAEHELPGEPAETQPLRLPEFPRKFDDTLRAVPRHVARNALAMIGRLAAGEAAAFTGVVRLKACPDVYRLRIGIDHRLLFRLAPDRLAIVDLISRQDLERRIKTLTTAH